MAKENHNYQKRVVVGLSGGVDSSVVAALLKEQGYAVVGVYMKNWNTESPTLGKYRLEGDAYRQECPWYEDYLDAKRVALHLEIPFVMWDFRQEYKQMVFDHVIEEFAAGRTPNPDVYCNSLIKFDVFLQRAVHELRADFVATGHYARLVTVDKNGEGADLQIPKDKKKDQTYFLYRLTADQRSRLLFPLAEYTKQEVRKLAEKYELPTQYRPESMGICFVGDVQLRQFLALWLKEKPGNILDCTGRVIGRHEGVHFYTIGQKVAVDNGAVMAHYPALSGQIPSFYVTGKKVADASLIVAPGFDNPLLYKSQIELESPIFTADPALAVYARLRHGGALLPISKVNGARVILLEPARAVAPGQHIVFYSQDYKVVGGAVMA